MLINRQDAARHPRWHKAVWSVAASCLVLLTLQAVDCTSEPGLQEGLLATTCPADGRVSLRDGRPPESDWVATRSCRDPGARPHVNIGSTAAEDDSPLQGANAASRGVLGDSNPGSVEGTIGVGNAGDLEGVAGESRATESAGGQSAGTPVKGPDHARDAPEGGTTRGRETKAERDVGRESQEGCGGTDNLQGAGRHVKDSADCSPGESCGTLLLLQQVRELWRILELQRQAMEEMARLIEQHEPLLEPRPQSQPAATPGEPDNTMRASVSYSTGNGFEVTQHLPQWRDHFKFIAAVKLPAQPTAMNVLPHESDNGLGRYVAIGDSRGAVLIMTVHGTPLFDIQPQSSSPVTVLLSLMRRRNETLLVVGHHDGSVFMHHVEEAGVERGTVEEMGEGRKLLLMGAEMMQSRSPGPPVVILERFQAGRRRYLVIGDAAGLLTAHDKVTGALLGSVQAPTPVVAFMRPLVSSRTFLLLQQGAASLQLPDLALRPVQCSGMGNSVVHSYAFDLVHRNQAYGAVVDTGELLTVQLTGDNEVMECKVVGRQPGNLPSAVVLQTIRGYLLAYTAHNMSVFNTTSPQPNRPVLPRLLLTSSNIDILHTFSQAAVPELTWSESTATWAPLMAVNRERLALLHLGGTSVATFESLMPTRKPEEFHGAHLWTNPVFVFIVFIIGAWQFFSRSRLGVGTQGRAWPDPDSELRSFLQAQQGREGNTWRDSRPGSGLQVRSSSAGPRLSGERFSPTGAGARTG